MIEYRSRDDDDFLLPCRATASKTVTGYTVRVSGLTGGTTYEFRIAAVNEIGLGEYAETPEACIPPSSCSYLSLSGFVNKILSHCMHTDIKRTYLPAYIRIILTYLLTYVHRPTCARIQVKCISPYEFCF